MAKKSFKDQDNPALAYIRGTQEEQEEKETQDAQEVYDVHNTQDTYDTHDVHNAQEVQKVQNTPKTQGRKGQKLPRINMAFSQDNLEYLQIISRMEGISMTEYVNRLIAVDREERKDLIKKAKALLTEAKK